MRKVIALWLLGPGLVLLAGCRGAADGPPSETAAAPHPQVDAVLPAASAEGKPPVHSELMEVRQAPEPADPEPGDSLPGDLRGNAEDEVLILEVTAVREDDGRYRATASLTNKSGAGVELLYDCGYLLHLWYPDARLQLDSGQICPAVHSMLFPAGETMQREFVFDAREQGFPDVVVVYSRSLNGSHRHALRAVLEPIRENDH